MAIGPNLNQILPDPVLTNVATDVWGNGGFVGDLLAPVKQVPKDRYKFATWDKSVLQQVFEALRTPGSRATIVPRPEKSYTEGLITEAALRVEYTQEDVDNAISPDEPAITGTRRMVNALQYIAETRIHSRYLISGFAAANKTTAAFVWSNASATIQKDIEKAKTAFFKRSGFEANYLLMPRDVWDVFVVATEIKNLRIYTEAGIWNGKGYPDRVFGLNLVIPGVRYDTVPTGTYTPGLVWNDDGVWIGYSPNVLGGTAWNGTDPTFVGQFEATLTGDTPFAVKRYLDPYFTENKTYILTSDFRRKDEVINPELVYGIATVK